MSRKARLETQITGDEAPFIASINRAEKRSESFSSRFQTLFRRSPEARTERALTGFLADLGSGNVGGAISGLTSKMHGFGLAAGIGIGVAVETFIKAKAQIDEVDKSVDKLNADLERPLGQQAALGAEGISKEIERTKSDLDTVIQKRKAFFPKLLTYLQSSPEGSAFKRGNNPDTAALGIPDTGKAQDAQESADKRLKRLSDARANAELDIVKAKKVSLTQSEQEGDLFKLHLDTQKQIAELGLEEGLNKPGRDQVTFFKRVAAIGANEKLVTDEVNRRSELRKNEIGLESRLIDVKESSLSADQKAVAAAKEKVHALQQQLALAQTDEQKAVTGVRLKGAQGELKDTLFNQADQSPEAVKARNAASLEGLRHQAFDTNLEHAINPDRAAYGAVISGIGAVGPQKPGGPGENPATSPQERNTPLTKSDLESVMVKYWGP